MLKKKHIFGVCLGIFIVSFLGIGAFTPPAEKDLRIEDIDVDENIIEVVGVIDNDENFEIKAEEVAVLEIPNNDDKIESQINVAKGVAIVNEDGEESIEAEVEADQQYVYYSVTKVVDGDTVKIDMNGSVKTLRLIGLDTPETVDPRKAVQCFGREASDKAKELLTDKKVRMEIDETQGNTDKYGRQLAYIYREDGLFFNKYMIEEGYAHEYTYDTSYRYQAEFKSAEKFARENEMGLWSPETCGGDTTQAADKSELSDTVSGADDNSGGKYYTSSFRTSKYYYPELCDGWKSLSEKYLKMYNSLDDLLAEYPDKTPSAQCE